MDISRKEKAQDKGTGTHYASRLKVGVEVSGVDVWHSGGPFFWGAGGGGGGVHHDKLIPASTAASARSVTSTNCKTDKHASE